MDAAELDFESMFQVRCCLCQNDLAHESTHPPVDLHDNPAGATEDHYNDTDPVVAKNEQQLDVVKGNDADDESDDEDDDTLTLCDENLSDCDVLLETLDTDTENS